MAVLQTQKKEESMVSKKRAAKSAKAAAKAPAKVAAKTPVKAAAKVAEKPMPKAEMPAVMAKPGMCCGTTAEAGCPCCMGCHVLGLFTSKATWAALALTAVIIVGFEMFWHSQILMSRYLETANLWLPQDQMNPGFFIAGQLGIAVVFTVLFRLAYRGTGLLEGVKLGVLIMAPLAIALLYVAGSQAIPADILQMWALGYVLQGIMAGVACASLLKGASCCGKSC